MKNENKVIGARGERIARDYLESKGYKIIQKNFNCRFGEIDIIAKKEKQIIFVEVKTRQQTVYGIPAESVNFYKQKHIYKAAEFYIHINDLYDVPLSLDIIEIYIFDDGNFHITHMKNAIVEKPYRAFTGW